MAMETQNHTQKKDLTAMKAPAYAAIVLWMLTFFLSCRIFATMVGDPAKASTDSFAGMILGESRIALAWYFYRQAETYFHAGWERRKNEAFSGSIYQKIAGKISPRHHIHLSGPKIKEIMPWLSLATRMDPHNTDFFFDAAFWLAHDVNRPDLAEQVLYTAHIENPYNYQVQFERGRIFLMQHTVDDAKRGFDAGLAFWPGKNDSDSEDAMDWKAKLLLYRALLHEADGEKEKAIANLREILELFPDRISMLERIHELEDGKEPSLLASKIWSDMIKHDMSKRADNHFGHPGEK